VPSATYKKLRAGEATRDFGSSPASKGIEEMEVSIPVSLLIVNPEIFFAVDEATKRKLKGFSSTAAGKKSSVLELVPRCEVNSLSSSAQLARRRMKMNAILLSKKTPELPSHSRTVRRRQSGAKKEKSS